MREFRAHYGELEAENVGVAGISLDSPEVARSWGERLGLPYPLLSDHERVAGSLFHITRSIGIGDFKVEFFRRATLLIDASGIVRAVWEKVKIRGHATEVLDAAKALRAVE
jgi:peroxiredoxin Q/BCP